MQKSSKFGVKFSKKTGFFLISTQTLVNCFIPNISFVREKAVFWGNKTLDQHFGANLKNLFFAKFCYEFVTFLHYYKKQKNLKKTISTSVWVAQHPNACQNIQH